MEHRSIFGDQGGYGLDPMALGGIDLPLLFPQMDDLEFFPAHKFNDLLFGADTNGTACMVKNCFVHLEKFFSVCIIAFQI